MEPPRSGLPRRASAPQLNTAPSVRAEPGRSRRPRRAARDLVEHASGVDGRLVAFGPAVAAIAAFVLAATSRGDVIVLATLLAIAARRRARVVAVALASAAVVVRWGSSSLGAIAGAQAVLGPAGWTGNGFAVVSSWLAAGAIVASVPVVRPVPEATRVQGLLVAFLTVPFALTAADVVVGPGRGGAIAARVLGSIVAVAVAYAVGSFVTVPARARAVEAFAVVAAAAALVLAGVSR